jgi:succinate dehydrogenase/fumarate reductase flavoprotein subunit
MRSSVPGLYAAGGVSGHSNGLIGLATYDGKVVADAIAAELNSLTDRPVPESEGETERRRLEKLRSRSNAGVSPAKVKEKLRQLMWDKVGVEKNATGLR